VWAGKSGGWGCLDGGGLQREAERRGPKTFSNKNINF